MDKWPQPFWATVLALQGMLLTVVCVACSVNHNIRENVLLASLAIASNLVSGALGAFASHATSQKPPANPPTPADPAQH